MPRDATDRSRDPAVELALRAARVGIWSWDMRADAVHWSPEVYELFRLDPAAFDPTFEGFLVHVPESYRSRLRTEIEEFVKRGEPSSEYRVVFPVDVGSGPYRWVEARGELRLDEEGRPEELLGIVQDVTARRSEEQEREYHRIILESAAVGMAQIHTPTGRFVRVNRHYQEMLGYTEVEMRDLTFMDVSHDDELPEDMANMERMMAGEIPGFTMEKRLFRRDGTPFWVNLTVSRMWAPGEEPEFHVAVVEDITARRRAEEERRRLERRMLQAQKLESLGVLAGGIAHDFNNLLVAVQGNADLARLDLPPESPARAYLGEICAAAQRAAGLCQQMLAYSGRGTVRVEPLDLGELVRDMVRILTVSLSKKAELCLDLAADLPAVRGDATQLRQVLMNLITNANEALGDGSGRIEVRAWLREAAAADAGVPVLGEVPDGPMVALEVRDDGCGMDARTREKMFDPFFTTKFAGRGLGMAAVLGIASAHGGSVMVESRPGDGTAVRVLLPPSEEAAATDESPDPDEAWSGSGKVLVVDDEPDARRVSQRMLERLGLQVVLASDGREALEVFRTAQGGLSLVLLDLTMPEMDGVETLAAIRAMEGPEVPVLVTSGYAPEEVRARFAAFDVAGFLYKPYRLDTLRSTVRGVLTPA